MARRYNDLYIGSEHLNIEGRAIKHPSLIKLFATVNLNKTREEPLGLIGLDLETNADTAELKLLGFYDGKQYAPYYNEDFIPVIYTWVKHAYKQEKALAYWNKLDPFVIYKQFLKHMTEKERILSMMKFGKVGGEWDKDSQSWDIKPICEIHFGDTYFGIANVIRSSIQFYFRREHDEDIKKIWAYDIASLYQNGLEKEATKRFKYYSKVDKSAHIVDWVRFDTDDHFKNNVVLKSNELDARAVHDLGYEIQNEFKEAFGVYPSTLISQGSLARSGIVATIANMYPNDQKRVSEDVSSIGIVAYLDGWANKYGNETVKDLLCLMFEAYSGGQIEAYAYGYSKEAFTADLTQAYPYHIQHLYDLRGSIITQGKGTPPHKEHSYCLIRGDVNIPLDVDYHPLTIKHPIHHETNIRAVGEYRASYTLEERDFLEELGATFNNEEWYNIETTGELSPLATVCKVFTDLRAKLKPFGKDYVAKIASASLYGILFEAVDTFIEENDVVYRDGYRGGEFLNPLYATIITSRTRLQVSRTMNEIKAKGGTPILAMTDSVFWEGTADMVDPETIREVKTVGYYEKPSLINDLVCLGSGRYGYRTEEGYMQAKRRGLNATEIHDPDGMEFEEFDWMNALHIMEKTKGETISIGVRVLVSVGMVTHNSNYTWKDLGRVVTEQRDVDVLVGRMKRVYDADIKDASQLISGLLLTEPIHLSRGMFGDGKLSDQTLPNLRKMLMAKEYKTAKQKRNANVVKANKRYQAKKGVKDNMNAFRSNNYKQLREYGYNSYEASKMQGWNLDKINKKLREDNKI